MNSGKIIAALGAMFLSACAGGPAVNAPAVPTGPAEATLGEVPAQQLNKGQCALVLWSHKSPPLRFLVSLSDPAVVRVQLEGKLVEIARVAQSGQPFYGQFPDQRYRGNGVSLGVSFSVDGATALAGGAVVSSAVVEYADANGWTTVIPAAGLIACQT